MTIKPGEDGLHPTYCRLCEAQCGVLADVKDGKIINILPDRDHPVSKGHLCVKAKGMLEVTYDDDRVLTPLKRTGKPGEFEPVSWDDALGDIATRLGDVIEQHGGTSVSSYIGNPAAFSTMHYGYGYGFIRMLGGDKFFNAQHVDTGARTLASDQVFGGPGRFPFPDIPDTHLLMIFGGNPLVSHMSLISSPRARNHLDAIHKRDGVVVVDPRRTETARRYEHQPIKPDGDVWLLIGMLKTLLEESLMQPEFIAEHVVGWDELATEIAGWSWDQVVENADIAEDRIRELARRFAASDAAACYGRVGTNRGRFSTLSNILMDAINLGTGNFGKRGAMIIGVSAFEPAEGRNMPSSYGKRHSRFGNIPIIAGPHPGGSLADEILVPGDGQIHALFVDSGNPVISYPDGDKTARAFESLDLFVSLDFYVTESNRYADYILPTPTFYERADINDMWSANAPEPWVHYVDAAVPPMGQSRLEYDIYADIAERMGYPDPISFLMGKDGSEGRGDLFDIVDANLRRGVYGDQFGENPDGLSVEVLRERYPHGVQTLERMDTNFTWNKISYPDGRARAWTDLVESEFARLRKEKVKLDSGELRLFGRRLLHGMNSWMHNSDKVIRNARPTLQMHPIDAEARQIEDGGRAKVASRNGQINVIVEITDEVVEGSVNYPHGFGHDGNWRKANEIDGANVNVLASSDPADWEPVTGNCHLDGIVVEVSPA